jgi:hypothetical protein
MFRRYDALQLSKDPTVSAAWFKSFEISHFGGSNSIDLQHIPRRNESYGFIFCSHVIEHVADYRAALRELARILDRKGLAYLAWPNPMTTAITCDWGYPDPSRHGHYRVFGRDFESERKAIIPDVSICAVIGRDSVTGAGDLHYIMTKDVFWKQRICAVVPGTRVIQ